MIPKIIHQIWSDIYRPLPRNLEALGETWKNCHPEWKYMLWNEERMSQFITENFPEYLETYNAFPYNVQRWDAIRYLILYKMGGMYVDFDYECFECFDQLLDGKKCCFSREPDAHIMSPPFDSQNYFNNALIACEPQNPFIGEVIQKVFSGNGCQFTEENKGMHVLFTTGPQMLTNLYERYDKKEDVFLIPAEQVSPFSIPEIRRILAGEENEEYELRLQPALALHYFFGDWHRFE